MAEERVQRRLAAILAADVAGYSRLMMGEDEEATLGTFKTYRKIIDGLIVRHDGRVFSTGGDSVLAEFGSVVEAVRAAISIQEDLTVRNAELAEDRRMSFRIGINVGDVMVEGDDLFGDGVNVAARLQELAETGGIAISGNVHEQINHKLDIILDDMGEVEVKNISRPIHVWSWTGADPQAASALPGFPESLPLPHKPSIAVLPFVNMSGDPEQDYFADGMAEDLITALSKYHCFTLTARPL